MGKNESGLHDTEPPLRFGKTFHCQKRPTTESKETYMSKEASLGKMRVVSMIQVRDAMIQSQKRPTTVKRDLLQSQKRPTTKSKETYK